MLAAAATPESGAAVPDPANSWPRKEGSSTLTRHQGRARRRPSLTRTMPPSGSSATHHRRSRPRTRRVDALRRWRSQGRPRLHRREWITNDSDQIRHGGTTSALLRGPSGVAKQAVRRSLEGSRARRLQARLPHPFWCDAAQAFCALRNSSDKADGRRTPCYRRLGHDFCGLIVPSVARIEFKPGSQKEKDGATQCASRTTRGVFAGYHSQAGGLWSGGYIYDEESLRSAEVWRHAHSHRIREIVLPIEENFVFLPRMRSSSRTSTRMGVKVTAERNDTANDAGVGQEGPPADENVAKDDWLDRRTLALCVHEAPRRRVYDDRRSLSDLLAAERRFDKLLRAPAGCDIFSSRMTRTQKTSPWRRLARALEDGERRTDRRPPTGSGARRTIRSIRSGCARHFGRGQRHSNGAE